MKLLLKVHSFHLLIFLSCPSLLKVQLQHSYFRPESITRLACLATLLSHVHVRTLDALKIDSLKAYFTDVSINADLTSCKQSKIRSLPACHSKACHCYLYQWY